MPRDRALLEWLKIERDAPLPLQRQVGDQLRAAITTGRLPPGTLLPSSRNLAAELSVARGTVTAIYDRLIGEGLLHVRERSAVFVAESLGREDDTPSQATGEAGSVEGSLPLRHAAFGLGIPAVDNFPAVTWSRLLAARSQSMSLELVGERVHVGGYPALRAALAGHLRTARGVLCEPDQVIITSSARAALTIVCRLLARPGDRCLIEDPGYPISRRIIAACGLEPIPIPVDDDGIRVEPPIPKARLAYLTPTHQLPLGVSLSAERCHNLLDWASREDAWIVEDDYDNEFRRAGRPVIALQHHDPAGRVIYIGTFSKTMFPSLRVGYLVVPKRIAGEIATAALLGGQEPTLHVQAALADFIAQGHYARHIRAARKIYRRRQKLLVGALNDHLDGILSVAPQPGGMNLLVRLPSDIPAETVKSLALSRSLRISTIGEFAVRAEPLNALLLGFAAVPDREIAPAAARLGQVIHFVRSGPLKSP